MRVPPPLRRAVRTAVALLLSLGAIAASASAAPAAVAEAGSSARVVVYYQKHFQTETPDRPLTGYISPLPLLAERTGADVVILGAIHMDPEPSGLTINLVDPADPGYAPMWQDLRTMQDAGIEVTGMLGGAVNSTWKTLADDFDRAYPQLRDFVTTYGLDGLDLDIETMEPNPRTGEPAFATDPALVIRLVEQLRADFGPGFRITMAPVAPALAGDDTNLSGFDYDELYVRIGAQIDWFNVQFYCGWAEADAEFYESILGYQATSGAGIPASKVVMIALTNPDNCGGFVPIDELASTVTALTRAHRDFGGVAGWEYFNSLPGGTDAPWTWAAAMRAAIRAADDPAPQPAVPLPPAVAPTVGSPMLAESGTSAPKLWALAIGGTATLAFGVAVLVRSGRRQRLSR